MGKNRKKGFTLIELIVCIAIIGVLATILVPSMIGYIKKSKRRADIGTARNIYSDAASVLAEGGEGFDAYTENSSFSCSVNVEREDGNESYTLEVVATCLTGVNSSWQSNDADIQPFVDEMNELKDGGIQIKYTSPKNANGNSTTLDRWFVGRRSDDPLKIEVWAGDASNTPCYRIWPETAEDYT